MLAEAGFKDVTAHRRVLQRFISLPHFGRYIGRIPAPEGPSVLPTARQMHPRAEDVMDRLSRGAALVIIGGLLASCGGDSQPVAPSDTQSSVSSKVAATSAPLLAHMQFGIDEHGSPFPPPDQHDGSGHARDHVYPREVIIARGGQVAFHIDLVHQVAVYEPGVDPEDIVVGPSTLEDVDLGPFILPNFRINDPTNRIVLGPPQQLFDQDWTTPAGTFDQPGRYLVICTSVPHFVASNMWGWVMVK